MHPQVNVPGSQTSKENLSEHGNGERVNGKRALYKQTHIFSSLSCSPFPFLRSFSIPFPIRFPSLLCSSLLLSSLRFASLRFSSLPFSPLLFFIFPALPLLFSSILFSSLFYSLLPSGPFPSFAFPFLPVLTSLLLSSRLAKSLPFPVIRS